MKFFVSALLVVFVNLAFAQNILLFVSHDSTYYTEYIVMKEALEASGYTVDVRSANAQDFTIYTVPTGTSVAATANSLVADGYETFQKQFHGLFGASWNESLNATPSQLPVTGSIIDVENFSNYDGLIVAGGLGALKYRLDGSYESQGETDRLIDASTMQAAAQKLNDLAVEALHANKPVMAQCHGASLPVFWRVPLTEGPGVEALGYSLLKGGEATGYPEPSTGTTLADFGVTHKENNRVSISSPHSSFSESGAGDFKILTTRDWYPQTVAHAARTFLNVLETNPSSIRQETSVSVLVLHGGEVNTENCIYTNRENDVPCNYPGSDNLPADYTDLMTLLQANSTNDNYTFEAHEQNMTAVELPYDPSSTSSVLEYLQQYDVVVFYKHWSTGLTDEILQALTDYADNGGGVVGIHHALYNDVNDAGLATEQDKEILADLFGAQSPASGWSGTLANYDLHSTNYGHFISTYGINYPDAQQDPTAWNTNPIDSASNTPYSFLPALSIYDEPYGNTRFQNDVALGRAVNEITPLFSNDQTPEVQCHTAAFTRLVDFDENEIMGRVFYIQAGERRENYQSGTAYFQMIRNAVVWAAPYAVAQSISFEAIASKTYGSPNFSLPKLASSGLTISYESSDPTIASIDGNVVSIHKIGQVTITASQGGNLEFLPAENVQQVLSVGVEPLKISADNKSKVFGENDPALTYQITEGNLVEGDVLAGLLTRASGENAGTYLIEKGTLTASENYELTFIQGTLTIEKATASISITNLEQEYDGSPKSPTITTTPDGLSYILTFDGLDEIPTQDGTYDVLVTIDEQNYQGTSQANFEIIDPNALGYIKNFHTNVFPNPAKNAFILPYSKSEKLSLYDIQGNLKITAKTNELVDISALNAGLYFVKVGQDKDLFKLIKH